MEKQDSNYSAIYFHMGPGFHSRIEAQKFSQKYPHVLFIDQPQGVSFSELVTWAEKLIRHQSQIQQKPLCLLGHSFGGQIIIRALPRVRECVSEIRLLNSPRDSFDCFANLESTLSPETAHGAPYWKTQPVEAKMNLIFALTQTPGMAKAYWISRTAQEDYEKMANQYPPIDVESFIKIYSGYLTDYLPPQSLDWQGPVKIYYSLQDHLIRDFSSVKAWKEFFPQAQFIETPNIGHYGLFESKSLEAEFFHSR